MNNAKEMLRRIMVVVLCSLVGMSAMAYERQLTRQESDSVSHALATMWAGYLIKKSQTDGKEVSKEYMRGVQEALKLADVDDAYFQGLSEGIMIAQRIRQIEEVSRFKVDIPKFAYVLTRAEKGRPTGFSPQTAEEYISRLLSNFEQEEKVVVESEDFLKKKAAQEGIVKTPSGLLFEVITEGEGEKPEANDVVLVRYTGKLIDGTVFNQSEDKGGAFFEVPKLIPGFREGLSMMKKGGTYRLYIPAEIGYGDEGVFGKIPGGAATVFDVELIDFRHRDSEGYIINNPTDKPAEQSGE